MVKIRVHELAKELDKTSKEIIDALEKMGVKVSSHNSSLEDSSVAKIRKQFTDKKSDKAVVVKKPRLIVRKIGSVNDVKKEEEAKEELEAEEKQSPKVVDPVKKVTPAVSVEKKAEPPKKETETKVVEKKTEEPKKVDKKRVISIVPSAPDKKEEAKKEEKDKVFKKPESAPKLTKEQREALHKQRLAKKMEKREKKKTDKVAKRQKIEEQRLLQQMEEEAAKNEVRVIDFDVEQVKLKELGDLTRVSLADIMKEVLLKGLALNLNSGVDFDLAAELVAPYNVILEKKEAVNAKAEREEEMLLSELEEDEENLVKRSPVVTIMGHVDHGKTKLLDTIRKANVVDKEHGGITQHIGAYQVDVNGGMITFLDTPGHEAFTEIRARGAQVTDIVILIVAADDGIMPQTIEAINHAKAAAVPIIVAINKIDREAADAERVKQQLTEHGLIPEDWGGDTVCVPLSALTGQGVDDLLDMINLISEMKNLKANPNKEAQGVIVEARLSKGKGPVSTAIVKSGTLKVGDSFVIGPIAGKVRAMLDHKGDKIDKAGPSCPVEILGAPSVPNAGDIFQVVADEKMAKKIADERADELEQEKLRRKSVTLETLTKQIKEGQLDTLNILLKADTQGSIDAIEKSFSQLNTDKIHTHVIHSGTGAISESDIMLAKASGALLFGFNVSISNALRKVADDEVVTVKLYNIIYKAIDDVRDVIQGMEKPEYERVKVGDLEVRNLFKSSKLGTIAGCIVVRGKAVRNAEIAVVRKDNMVFESKLDSLKRFTDDVKEVKEGFECGIVINDFDGFAEGDSIEVYELIEKKRI